MKKCPYCAEDIQDAAIKCKHCGEFLNKKSKPTLKWYFRTSTIIVALLCIGPFALPLIWLHPNLNKKIKIALTIIILVISYGLLIEFIKAIESIKQYYNLIFNGSLSY